MDNRRRNTIRQIDPESGYDDPEEGLRAEEAAMKISNKINPRARPTRNYLNDTVSEIVLKALFELDQCRPDNPVEFFAYYLLKHNPEV
jgi:protein dpy-30